MLERRGWAGGEDVVDHLGRAGVREALALFRGLRDNGAEIGLHKAVLYNSIYCADNELLVIQHLYGVSLEREPVFCLRLAPEGNMTATYLDAFERTSGQMRGV
jgi:hypothetical protein